jgi:hypothetical protein
MPTWLEVRDTWKETRADLGEIFIKLNWGRPEVTQFSVTTKGGDTFDVSPVASLKNFHALQINVSETMSKSILRNVHREVSKRYPDNVLIVRDSSAVRIEWPRRKPDGDVKYDTFTTSIEQPHQLTFQKLAGAGFEISELSRATLEDVRARVYGLSSESVTKLFYEQFRDEHDKLAVSISSDAELSNEERHSYSSLLLNRLMFIYFLQKKEFLSNDSNLLNNVLAKCEESTANYYTEALLPLFFEGFNGQHAAFESKQLNDWWGEIPYINGGIFAPHGLEDKTGLSIPNSAFARVYEFFEKFDWHLDSRPLGTSNEINPEVLGYIFEQYINYTADGKKESGAYYTPEDVTGFMVTQTLIPRVLDEIVRIWPECLSLVKGNPSDYIHRALFHGATTTSPLIWVDAPKELLEVWEGDPIGWDVLDDADANTEICLPGETWVEMFYRRERVETLIDNLSTNGLEHVNDIVTLNLNGSKLVSDLIANAPNAESIHKIWGAISELSVIDPTCGSGAFLFAALTALEPIYEELLEALGDDAHTVGKQFDRGNIKYQVRKHIAMRNLYGTDIMADAIETAKLRIFLALAAVLERASELEPLPDLDFNLKAGNLVVGLYDIADASRINPEGTFVEFYNFDEIESRALEFQAKFTEFKKAEVNGLDRLPDIKEELIRRQTELRELVNAKYLEIAQIDESEWSDWVSAMKPFHWFTEFPEIIARGGFDIVIGNPPYIKKSNLDSRTKREILSYKATRCPDFFAVCYERSLGVLSDSGRHSLVVMLNLAFSDQFGPLREVISARAGAEWWSSFGKRPDALFRGVQVRNTILTVAPGAGASVSRHHLFSPDARRHLFSNLQYFRQKREHAEYPLRGGVAENIVKRVDEAPAITHNDPSRQIYVRPTGTYWFPVLPVGFPQLKLNHSVLEEIDHGLNKVLVPEGSTIEVATALLAGKIAYLWWSTTGDDFHVLVTQAEQVLRLAESGEDSNLQELAKTVVSAGLSHVFGSTNAGKIQLNIRWKSLRKLTDQFDREFLSSIGLGDEWRNLNIWYRQAMKAGRDNANGVDFSRKAVLAMLEKPGEQGRDF